MTPYGPDPVAPDGGSLPGPFPGNTVGAANWVASSGTTFDGTVSIALDGQGPIPWSMSRYNRGDFAVRLSPLDPAGSQDNFNTLQDFTGEGTTEDPYGHGTFVAGMIASQRGSYGGIATGANLILGSV